jgi:octanoyl-[GcvH]:protein N-octanoyltransferase
MESSLPRLSLLPALRLLTDSFPADPALDAAVSRALMFRVAAGELPETLRIARPGTTVAFAKRDAVTEGYDAAVGAAREHGFEPTLRLAGGRAAVFHDGTMEIGHAVPDEEPREGIHDRFRRTADRLRRALRRLGVDARVGEVTGEYCPGRYSVNARGAAKIAGIGQRVVSGGSHTGVVLVVDREDRINDVLTPVYRALGLSWNSEASGSVRTEVPTADWNAVRDAIVTEYAREYDVVEDVVDAKTLELAESLVGEHRVG